MKIADNHVVTLNYILTDNDGEVIDQAQDSSFVYLHGAQNIIPGLEKEVADKSVGDKFTVKVSPEDGYGLRDDSRVESVPRDMFPEDQKIDPGMVFHAEGPNGESITVTVMEITDEFVKIDSNHALAGIELNFDVEVMAIRSATETELEHGHIHGEGCNHD